MSELNRLRKRINQLLELKQDKVKYIGGLLGNYVSGQRVVRVNNRPGFVYVRLGGNLSEVVEAVNGVVSEIFDLKVLIRISETNSNIYEVVGRDKSQYPSWSNEQPYLPRHGNMHSFSSEYPNDPVFVYRKQLVQPLQPHPTEVRTDKLKVEADFYIFNNEIKYFPGDTTVSLSGLNPPYGGQYRWITVYLDSITNTLSYITGSIIPFASPFSLVATGIVYNIPEIDPTYAIPLAAVYLVSGTSLIGWDDYQDIRPFIVGGTQLNSYKPTITIYGNYTIDNNDYSIFCNPTGSSINLYLPNVSGSYNWQLNTGLELNIKKDNDYAPIIVIAETGTNIDDTQTKTLNTPFVNMKIQTDGRNWRVM